jgi:hypothetical protein
MQVTSNVARKPWWRPGKLRAALIRERRPTSGIGREMRPDAREFGPAPGPRRVRGRGGFPARIEAALLEAGVTLNGPNPWDPPNFSRAWHFMEPWARANPTWMAIGSASAWMN